MVIALWFFKFFYFFLLNNFPRCITVPENYSIHLNHILSGSRLESCLRVSYRISFSSVANAITRHVSVPRWTIIFHRCNTRAIIFHASPPLFARLPARRMLVRRSPDNNIRVTHTGIHFQTSISRPREAFRSFYHPTSAIWDAVYRVCYVICIWKNIINAKLCSIL